MTNADDAYSNGAYIAGAEEYPPRWATLAQAFREAMHERAVLDQPYGPSSRMCYDLFHPEGSAKGCLIFVHGGYWRAFDKSSWSHLAAGALSKGWSVAMPSYDLCPDVSIAMITQQIAQAVLHIATRNEGDLALAGHSAGGHLVARMLAPGILHQDIRSRIVHVMPISPLSDLDPLRQTAMNADFKLDAEMAEAESPLAQPKPDTPVTVWVGGDERPVFLDQAAWLAAHWDCAEVIDPGKHHFNVIDALSDPGSQMMQRLLG